MFFSDLFICMEYTFGDLSPFEYLVMFIRTLQHILALTIYTSRPPKHHFVLKFSELLSIDLVKYEREILLHAQILYPICEKHHSH